MPIGPRTTRPRTSNLHNSDWFIILKEGLKHKYMSLKQFTYNRVSIHRPSHWLTQWQMTHWHWRIDWLSHWLVCWLAGWETDNRIQYAQIYVNCSDAFYILRRKVVRRAYTIFCANGPKKCANHVPLLFRAVRFPFCRQTDWMSYWFISEWLISFST